MLRLAQLKGEIPFNYQLALFIGDALIGRSRSQACSKFLEETEVPYFLFIDDDIIFNPNDVTKVYQHLKSGKYDVIGGVYPVRGASQLSSYGWDARLDIDGQVREIEYLATGFMGISRGILNKIKDDLNLPICNPKDWSRCWPFFENGRWLAEKRSKGGDNLYISEDWDFCEKVRMVGGKIYADTSIQLGHLREQVFTPSDVLRVQSEAEMKKQVYAAVNHHSELIRSVDTDLSEFLNIPLKQAQNRMKRSRDTLAHMWEGRQGTVEDFYKNNEVVMMDNAAFNYVLSYFPDRLSPLLGIKGAKILDIGCGIGTASFVLAEQGNEVIGWDINKQSIDFANFKKKKYDLKGEFTQEAPDFSQFDIVVAIDVLEHIENLEEFLRTLGSGLKSGVKFYHSDYFQRLDPQTNMVAWPMHFEEHKDKLSGWLVETGFVEWDGIWCVMSLDG